MIVLTILDDYLKYMRRYFHLLGKNIHTSLSPPIHNAIFASKSLPWIYITPKVNDHFTSPQKMLLDPLFGGCSITMPYKSAFRDTVISFQDQCSKVTGNINTVVRNGPKLLGYNTDLYGIAKCLGGHQTKNALILGAGATAQTFCYYFKLRNCRVSLLNRSMERAQILKSKYSIIKHIQKLEETVSTNFSYDTIVNTLPLSYGEQCAMKLKQSYPEAIYMSVNYRTPQITKQNEISGLDMLIWQAILQNNYFCGEKIQEVDLNFDYAFDAHHVLYQHLRTLVQPLLFQSD